MYFGVQRKSKLGLSQTGPSISSTLLSACCTGTPLEQPQFLKAQTPRLPPRWPSVLWPNLLPASGLGRFALLGPLVVGRDGINSSGH